MSQETKELSRQIIAALVDAKGKASIYASKAEAYRRQKHEEFIKALGEDPHLRELQESTATWDNVYLSGLAEVMTPGTIVYTGTGLYGLYIVSEISTNTIYGFEVTYPPKKRSRSSSVWIGIGSEIWAIDDITDKRLRRVAENLIAKIRMKDW